MPVIQIDSAGEGLVQNENNIFDVPSDAESCWHLNFILVVTCGLRPLLKFHPHFLSMKSNDFYFNLSSFLPSLRSFINDLKDLILGLFP